MESPLSDCRNLLYNFFNLIVKHVYRVANQCVEALVNLGLHLNDSFVTFANSRHVVENLPAFDKAELYYIHMVCI